MSGSPNHRLLLFDIDGTLLDTGGAGAGALLDAAEDVLQVRREHLPPLDLAGATDGGVLRKLFADAGQPLDPDRVEAYYAPTLAICSAAYGTRSLPGGCWAAWWICWSRSARNPVFQ